MKSSDQCIDRRLLTSIFDLAPDCIKLLNANGEISLINRAGLRIAEAKSAEDLQGISVFELVAPDHREATQRIVQRAFAGEAGQVRFELIGLKGGRRWLELHAAPFREEDGRVTGVLGVSRDISALVGAEEQRKELEGRTEALVKALKEVIYEWHPPERVIWSGAYTDVLGYQPGEIGNTTESWSSRVHPNDLPAAFSELECARREGRNYDFEYRMRHRDGTYRWVHDRGVLTVNSEGELTRMIGVMIEITPRKDAECDLRKSEALFHTLASAAPIGIFRTDEAGHCIYVNERWSEISGLSEKAAIEKGWFEAVHPEDRERVAADWRRLEKRGQVSNLEFRLLTPDGRVRWVLGEAVPDRTEEGEIKGAIGTFADITERKLIETALRESQEHLSSIVQSVDGIVWEAEADTFQFRFVSKSAERMLGYPMERWLEEGAFWVDHLHPDDKARAIEACRATSRERKAHEFEYRMLAADGKVVWMRDLVTVVVENGKAVKLRGIMLDITQQKLTEGFQRAASERYARQRTALTALTRSRVSQATDVHAAIHEITEVAARTLEVERVSVWTFNSAHKSLVCLDLFEKTSNRHSSGTELKEEIYPSYFEALRHEDILSAHDAVSDPRTAEFAETYLRPLGIRSMMDASIRLGGALTGVLCHEHTGAVREWKPDEESFALSVANLVSLVLAQNERSRVEEQLRQAQKLEAIGQLAGGVAHDFNNVLAVILMQTDLALMGETIPEGIRDTFQEIRGAADRAANLTRQLLLFSRRQVIQPREVDLNEVVTSIAKMLRRLIGEHIQLELHLHSSSLMIRADSGMLDQVLLNLAVNARDAMPHGGKLRIETSVRALDREMAESHPEARKGTYVCLTVSDSGIGIPPEILPRIFEPFFSTKEPGKGTGLGLATAFGIIKQHQGWIEATSEPGKGAEFCVFLPRAEAPQPASRGAQEPSLDGGSETILLAEDDANVRRLTRMILERHGYKVLEAMDGIEALRLWKEHGRNVSLLLTDLVMPGGISGHQLARSLQKENANLKVIFYSGYSPEIAGREIEFNVGETFLQKPCARTELLQAVRTLLNGQVV